MSYYTKAELVLGDPTTSLVGLETCLDELGISHDAIDEVHKLFSSGRTSMKVYPGHIDGIMVWVSQRHPLVRYVVAVRGEDEDVSTTRAYQNGTSSVATDKKPPRIARAVRDALAHDGNMRTYSPQLRYSVGEVIQHPSLGKGLVARAEPSKILVQFLDAERTLVHARGVR